MIPIDLRHNQMCTLMTLSYVDHSETIFMKINVDKCNENAYTVTNKTNEQEE